MPKRKCSVSVDQDYEKLRKKLKQIEKEIKCNRKRQRGRRVRVLSSSSSSSQDSSPGQAKHTSATPSRHESSEPELHQIITTQAQSTVQAPPTSVSPPTTQAPPEAQSILAPPLNPQSAATCDHYEVAVETSDDTPPELDEEILQILGVDPTQIVKFGKNIQKDLALRFEHTATKGITKDERKELIDKYLVPDNCKLVGAPAINPEIKAALSETVIKRDKVIASKQTLMASAISSLGEAISLILSSKEKNNELLRILMNTGRAICDCQHNDTMARRNFILFAVKKEMKESLQNTNIDEYLFGSNLADTLKTAKAINKSGAELKPATFVPKPSTSKQSTPGTSKNWRGSYPVRKPPGRTTAPPPAPPPPSSAARAASSAPSRTPRPVRAAPVRTRR